MAKKTLTSLFKSNDPTKCNQAMGLKSSKTSIKKLKYCQRDKATCPYHADRTQAK